jgi:undecaprenyl-diphosphatase
VNVARPTRHDLAGQRRPRAHLPRRPDEAATVPVLEARPGGPAQAVGDRLERHHPATAFTVAMVAGYVLLAALAVGLGFLLVDVLLPFDGLGRADEHVNRWLASHRDATLNDGSYVGSMIGDIPVLPIVVTLTAIALMIRRRWRIAAFVVAAILVEAGTYRVASLIVHRERPEVPRLDHLPANQSFPSGHVAASLAVYGGLALLLTSATRGRGRGVAIASWAIALVLVAVVASSRMYRGMHHPADVVSGLLIGSGALVVALLAARASGVVAERRETR